MKERQIEAMYRARFDERRHATDALDGLYREASAGRDTSARAWLVAVAHPRIPRSLERLSRADVRSVLEQTDRLALEYAPRHGGVHPIENVDRLNPSSGAAALGRREHRERRAFLVARGMGEHPP